MQNRGQTKQHLRVLVVSDIRLYREGLASVLLTSPSIEIVAATSDAESTMAVLLSDAPDAILLDLGCPGRELIIREATHHARGCIPVVALGVSDAEPDVLSAVEAGVAGYVSRNGSLNDLLDVVEQAVCGEFKLPPRIVGSLMRRLAVLATTQVKPTTSVDRLTLRERDVAHLLQQNLSNKEIATRLHIEVATVKNHVHNLLDKLNVRRRRDVSGLELPAPKADPQNGAALR